MIDEERDMGARGEELFRDVMSRFATGVTVMTTVADGVPHGMTANAVASVSLDPLLVLVCVERDTVMAELVAKSGVFALSMLAADQEHVSIHFAAGDRPEGDAMFAAAVHREAATGAPLLDGAIAWLDCRLWAAYDGGDHLIVVGEIADLDIGDARPTTADALVYFHHTYHRVTAADPA